ncbi:hypothetical protein JW960_11225 [candidate division KSB1 bacterium]|nr:hypothetical protein [candidate division KSB1 bacterium]
MLAIEFNAKIKNGIIRIPDQYSRKLSENVKVILIQEENDESIDKVEQLLQSPIKMKQFSPLTRDDLYERN